MIFTPEGTKIRGVRPTADIPAHTITDDGFCARLTKRCCSGILEDVSLISDHFGCLSPLRSSIISHLRIQHARDLICEPVEKKWLSSFKVSRGSLQNLVRNDLGRRSFKRKKVHFLSKQIREKWKSRSKILLNRLAN